MYVNSSNYQPLSGAGTTLSAIFGGPVGMIASASSCRGRCDWKFPFNREKREECKGLCADAQEERREARTERRADRNAELPPAPAPIPIVPIAIGLVAIAGAWFLFKKKAA